MDLIQRDIIESYRSQLTKELSAISLFPYLPCLTKFDRERIGHLATETEQNELLLDILQYKDEAWDQLLQALKQQNQGYLATVLATAAVESLPEVNSMHLQPEQKPPTLLEQLRQRLIQFYLHQFSSYQPLFPGDTKNVADLYINGCWLDLSEVLQESSNHDTVVKKVQDFYDGSHTSLEEISCPSFNNDNDIVRIIQASKAKQTLIAGDAGVGKTTFLKKLCYEWALQATNPETTANDYNLLKYTFVFAIPLRNVQADGTLPDLALRFLSNYRVCNYEKELLQLLETYCAYNRMVTLFLLDGLDEYKRKKVSERQPENLTLERILNEHEIFLEAPAPLPGTIIITTRPNAAKHAKAIRIHFKLLGLNKCSAHSYVERFFGLMDKKENISSVLTALKRHPHLGTTPLLLMLTCHLVHSNIVIPTGHRKELYDKVCLMLLKRAKMFRQILVGNLENWKELQIAKQLMQLAFYGELNGKLTFSATDLKQANVDQTQARETGLLREDYFFSLCQNSVLSVEYSFPHKSIQEHFAAEYVTSLHMKKFKNKKVLNDFYRNMKTEPILYAVKQDLLEYMRTLVARSSNYDVFEAVSEAAKYSSNRCLEWLVNNGHAISKNNTICKKEPVIIAANYGHLDTAIFLINRGAIINATDTEGQTALISAARQGHCEIVKLLLERGAKINTADYYGNTALITAASNGHNEIVTLLLEQGAQINTVNNYGNTSLIRAASNGHNETVILLLEGGAQINRANNKGNTALINSAWNGHNETVKLLLDCGAEINKADNKDNTPLLHAAWTGHKETAKLLLHRGAQVNMEDTKGNTAFNNAALNGYNEIVKLLLEHGAKINRADEKGNTALINAAWNGHNETVKLLLERGAQTNTANSKGNTALIYAARNSHNETVKLLLEGGANINSADEKGNTALINAAWNRHNVTVKLLLERGAHINMADNNGNSALIYAAWNGYNEIVKLLRERGAQINLTNNNGKTALIYAAHYSHNETVKLLLDQGAEINMAGNSGNTALICAARQGHFEIVKLLLDRGAQVNTADNNGNSALIYAAWNGYNEIVKLLLDRGAQVNTANNKGSTVLICTTLNRCNRTVKLLLDRGADINTADNNGNTSLMCAARQGDYEIVKLLLGRGAKANITNNNGNTALIYATVHRHSSTVKLLSRRRYKSGRQ